MILKKRKAVGGLISLIGLIVVFGIASIAYLELSSSQTSLINTSFSVSQKISDKNNERLNFTKISPTSSDYLYTVENLGSEITTINSHVTKNVNSFVGKEVIDISISAASNKDIPINISLTPDSADQIIFITDLGKKCLVPVDVSFRLC